MIIFLYTFGVAMLVSGLLRIFLKPGGPAGEGRKGLSRWLGKNLMAMGIIAIIMGILVQIFPSISYAFYLIGVILEVIVILVAIKGSRSF